MRGWWRLVTPVLVLALAWAVAMNWRSVVEALTAVGSAIIVVIPLGLAGLLAGAASWAVLQPAGGRWRAFRAFLIAQPAKYLPAGGFLQAASQVTMSAAEGEGAGSTSVSFGVHSLVQVGAGASVALLLAVQVGEASFGVLAVATVLVAVFLVLLSDSPFRWFMGLLKRVDKLRIHEGARSVSARARYVSWGLTTIPLAAAGGIFYIMVGGQFEARDLAYVVGAFAAAWVAGFLFFFIPVGLGVRESVLVFLLADLPASQVVAISAAHRATMLAIEAAAAVVVHLYSQSMRGRRL